MKQFLCCYVLGLLSGMAAQRNAEVGNGDKHDAKDFGCFPVPTLEVEKKIQWFYFCVTSILLLLFAFLPFV